MQKPAGYDETQVVGEFVKLTPGGHILEIKKVEECVASNGNPYINVIFDTDRNDSQPGYFMESYKNDTRSEKKWNGSKFVFINDFNDPSKTNGIFKGFTTSVEASNQGFSVPWGNNFAASFKDKKVGGVFREEEYEKNDGTIGTVVRLAWFQGINSVQEAKIPKTKRLKDDPYAEQVPLDKVPF